MGAPIEFQLLGVNPAAIAPPNGTEGIIGFEATALGNALLVSISGAPIVVNVNLDLADDEVAIGGPDSGGTRRLFQGRVDGANNIIESVPILSGAQALALGKAEDTAFVDGDTLVGAAAVRRDADAPDAADGDYTPLHTGADGRLKVDAAITSGGGGDQFARDSVAGATDLGTMALAVRNDTPGSSVGADGDYTPVQVDATGQLRVGGAAPTGLGKAEDSAAGAVGDVGVMALVVRRDLAGDTVGSDGDYSAMGIQGGALRVGGNGPTHLGKTQGGLAIPGETGAFVQGVRRDAAGATAPDGAYHEIQIDATGRVKVNADGTVAVGPTVTPGTGATDLGKAEDAVATSGATGVFALGVRRDAAGATAGDGDYHELQIDANGRLKVDATGGGGDQFARDSVAGATDLGTMALVVRRDTPGSSVGTDGDYAPAQVDAAGQLRVGGAAPTGLGKAQDAVAAANDVGVPALVVRQGTPSSGVAEGDYDRLKSDASSRLHVRALTGGGTSGTTTVVAVAAVSVALVVASSTLACATIQNRGPGPLYIRLATAGPATTSDFRLANGENIQFFCSPGTGIFGISNGAGASAVVIQEVP